MLNVEWGGEVVDLRDAVFGFFLFIVELVGGCSPGVWWRPMLFRQGVVEAVGLSCPIFSGSEGGVHRARLLVDNRALKLLAGGP